MIGEVASHVRSLVIVWWSARHRLDAKRLIKFNLFPTRAFHLAQFVESVVCLAFYLSVANWFIFSMLFAGQINLRPFPDPLDRDTKYLAPEFLWQALQLLTAKIKFYQISMSTWRRFRYFLCYLAEGCKVPQLSLIASQLALVPWKWTINFPRYQVNEKAKVLCECCTDLLQRAGCEVSRGKADYSDSARR